MFAKDYRKLAWSKLKGNWGVAIAAALIYSVLMSALSAFGGIGTLILGGALTVGLCGFYLALVRCGSAKLEEMFNNITSDFVSRMLAYILYSIYVALWSLLFVIPGIVKSYSYAMTFYILRDNPGIGANEAITRSRQMMNGHKWQLFCLHFSFIGWLLLCSVTFGIAAFWVLPYMQTAQAAFYENIKNEAAASAEPAAEFSAQEL